LPVKCLIKKSEYHDSITLMLVARELAKLPGVQDAAVVMGTEANRSILREADLLADDVLSATPNDLVIAVRAAEEVLDSALTEAGRLLSQKKPAASAGGGGLSGSARPPRSIHTAVRNSPGSNLAVISVAGRYAAAEAWDALRHGLHVLLFSDNVSLEDEIALKTYARESGLLLMGPGAGTAFLNGAALGFANAVPTGPVGVVSAAGTGLQEIVTLLARQGVGITQGIGVGGRDLKTEVGGLMTLAALDALQQDPATEVIVIVSKPPAAEVVTRVMESVARVEKPAVVCFLGAQDGTDWKIPHAISARTLQETALLAAHLAGAALPPVPDLLAEEDRALMSKALALCRKLHPKQRFLRGLFSGGTLCYEAQVIWRDRLPYVVLSNAPLVDEHRLADSAHSQGHTVIDLGEEEFTVGRPHPMIDNDLRIRRLLQEAADPQVAVLLLDIVLGYGAHPDPAAELAPALVQARSQSAQAGRELVVVGSVTGTRQDPQGYDRQVQMLQEAGMEVCESNAAAARLAAFIVNRGEAGAARNG
jgi:succinyl-CoA synthetase alpha subunit